MPGVLAQLLPGSGNSPHEGACLRAVTGEQNPVLCVTERADAGSRVNGDRSPSVLVVDDDRAIITLLTAVLKRKGFMIDTARNGEEAIATIAAKRFEAIILDLMMPKVDGFEVLEHLERTSPGMPEECVIVLTALANKDLRKLDGHKVFRVIRKPFDLEELVTAVAECVERSAAKKGGGEA
jgi:CheY-like chemotaxis protein